VVRVRNRGRAPDRDDDLIPVPHVGGEVDRDQVGVRAGTPGPVDRLRDAGRRRERVDARMSDLTGDIDDQT
jgi:hypothetical protein